MRPCPWQNFLLQNISTRDMLLTLSQDREACDRCSKTFRTTQAKDISHGYNTAPYVHEDQVRRIQAVKRTVLQRLTPPGVHRRQSIVDRDVTSFFHFVLFLFLAQHFSVLLVPTLRVCRACPGSGHTRQQTRLQSGTDDGVLPQETDSCDVAV